MRTEGSFGVTALRTQSSARTYYPAWFFILSFVSIFYGADPLEPARARTRDAARTCRHLHGLPQQGYAVGRDACQNFLMKHDLRLEKFSSSTRVVYNERLKNSIL